MARKISVTTSTKNGASVSPDEGTHAVGDLLCVFASNDGGGTELNTASTGWSKLGTTAASSGVRCAWFWKIATGTTGETPTITGANDDWTFSFYVIRGAHATQPFGATPTDGVDFKRTDFDLTSVKGAISIAASALTTATDNCLLLIGIGQDNLASTSGIKPNPDDFVMDAPVIINGGFVGHITGSLQFGAAGATPALTAYSANQDGGNAWIIAVRDDGNANLQPDCRLGGEVIKWHGDFGSTFETLTYSSPKTNFDTTTTKIDGLDCSTTAPTISTATDLSASPGTITTISDATNGGSDVWAGMSHTITATNMENKIVSLRWAQSSLSAPFGTKGVIVVFGSGATMTTDWAAYKVIENALTLPGFVQSTPYQADIAVGNSTAYATAGTVDWTAITRIGFMYHRTSGSATARLIWLRNMILHDTAKLIGGCADDPVKFSYLPTLAETSGIPFIHNLQGSGQILAKSKVQIGDGATPTYFKLSPQSFEFPSAQSLTNVKLLEWNVPPSVVGVTIYAKAGDTIDFSAGILATATAQPFTIHASSAAYADATYSFSGTSIVGWDVADNKGLTWIGTTFKDGGTVTIAGGGDLTNCTISDTTSTNAALAVTANGSTLDGCTIDGTGAAYALELGTAVTAITLTDCTLTAGSTDKVHVKATTGTVTITISGTTSLIAADVTTDGATVVIAAPQPTLDATVLANSRVVLYNNTTDAELDNTAPAGTSWSKVITSGASANDSLTLHVFKEGYQEFSTTFLYTGEDQTILVTQVVDSNIASLRTELGITDYTTITEFALDITGSVEIDADDADGSTTKARLAIWYNGVLTTENGARYLRGAITILSTAAFRINTSVLDLKMENISATYGLNFTDTERRLYRDDGAPIYAAASAAGSIQNDYSGVPDTVETGVSGLTGSESAQLMALPSASTIASTVLTSAQSTPIYADARKMNGATITGTGVDSDLWRGA